VHRSVIAFLTFLIALVLWAPDGSAQSTDSASGRVYSVSAFIYEDNRLIGAPVLTVREGVTGLITRNEGASFAFEVNVVRAGADAAARFGRPAEPDELHVEGAIYFADQASWREVIAPAMLVGLDRRATVEQDIYGQNFRRAGADDFIDSVTVEILVTEVDESWFENAGQPEADCSIDTLASPMSPDFLVETAAQTTGSDDNCCTTSCFTCCNACCCDSANCNACCCAQGGAP